MTPPVLVTDSRDLSVMLEQAADAPIIGVDTESNSLHAYYHRICLIQVSLPGIDYVVDPLSCDAGPMGELFADPRREKIFHAAENDILGLKRDFGFEFANLFDTMMAARIMGWPQAGLAAILEEGFGVKLDKRLQRTNWGRRPLRPEELAYAQLDTHYLLPLREQQARALKECGRWEEAQEAFERLLTVEWTEKPFDEDGFWRINGARNLSGRELAVLRELYLYREEQAQRQDRPPFKVLDNRVLLAISRRQPDNFRSLRWLLGISAEQARRYGNDILAAVARGQNETPPRPPQRTNKGNGRPDPATRARYDALRNWRTQRAEQRGVDPDVILTNDALMTIARSAPVSADALAATNVMGSWKLQEYAESILQVLNGNKKK